MKKSIVGLVLLAVGLMWLSTLLNIYDFTGLWQQPWTHYVAAATVAIAGLYFLSDNNHSNWNMKAVPVSDTGEKQEFEASFSGNSYCYNGEHFRGARLNAHFGGIRLDLRQAVFEQNCEMEIRTFFGGVELFVPVDVHVEVSGKSIVGGVTNSTPTHHPAGAKTIRISVNNYFGGVSIQN